MKNNRKGILIATLLILSIFWISTTIVIDENSVNDNSSRMNSKIPDRLRTSSYSSHQLSDPRITYSSYQGPDVGIQSEDQNSNNGNEIVHTPIDLIPNRELFSPVEEGSAFHYYYGESTLSNQNNLPVVKIENDKIEYIVKTDSSFTTEDFLQLGDTFELEIIKHRQSISTFLVSIPLEQVNDFEADLYSLSGFRYSEPNYYNKLNFVPDDAMWSSQWGPQHIGMENAWNTTIGNRSVVVAVIDTGIDYNHSDLSDAYVTGGYDWYNDDTDPFDDHYHGTHVAGTIAAHINNVIGVAGIGNVSVIAEKIFSSTGAFAGTIDAAAAIDHAVAQGADILSNSWGGGPYSQLLEDAVANTIGNGSMFIAAAGNDASSAIQYPAAYDGAISVSATDSSDNLASFSNYGDWIDIAAPGVDILSTYPTAHANGPYFTISGTSMATPHVSGLAALIMSQFPDYTIEQVENLLYFSADDIGTAGFDTFFGNGRINASTAMNGLPDFETSVSLDVPAPILEDTLNNFTATVSNLGSQNLTDVDLELYINDTLVNSTTFAQLNASTSASITYGWQPSIEGNYNVTVFSPYHANDTNPGNNILESFVEFTIPLGRIGVVTAHGEVNPTGLYTFYEGLGYEVTEITTITSTSFDNYDMLIVTEGGSTWSSGDLAILDTYFQNGGKAAVFGDSGTSSITWVSNYGITISSFSASSGTTTNVQNHPLTENVNSMYAGGPVASLTYTNGQSLVMDSANSRSLVGISNEVNLVVYADDMRVYYTNADNGIFLENLMTNWFSYEKELMAIDITGPAYPTVNNTYSVDAEVLNWGKTNLTNYNVSLYIDDVLTDTISNLNITIGESQTISFNWTTSSLGTKNITAVFGVVNETRVDNNAVTAFIEVVDPDQAFGFTSITVYDNLTSTGIVNASVQVYNSTGSLIDNGFTDGSGFYNVTGLDIGTYTYNITAFDYFNMTYVNTIDFIGEAEIITSYLDPVLDHELIIWVSTEPFAEMNQDTNISITIMNDGIQNETNIEFNLYIDGIIENTQNISSLLVGQSVDLIYTWNSAVTGNYNVTGYVVPITNEEVTSNNADTQYLEIVDPDLYYGFTEITVSDSFSSNAIENVMVDVYNSTGDLIDSGLTDVTGFYNVTGLDIGTYTYNLTVFDYYNTSFTNTIDFIGESEISNIFLNPVLHHELILTLNITDYASLGESTILGIDVLNNGTEIESDVQVELYIDGVLVDTVNITSINPGIVANIQYDWTPGAIGNANITAVVLPVSGELVTSNNQATGIVTVFDFTNTVAVLNASSSEQPSYWTGGWANSYTTIVNGLTSQGINAVAVTNADIVGGVLSNIYALVLIDNAPNDAASSVVKSWWQAGGSILSFDSSISTLNWIGALPSEAEGTNGNGAYWDYSSTNTGVLADDRHPVSEGYSNGSAISGVSGNARYFTSTMQSTTYGSYYTPIVKSALGSNYDFVVASDAPSGGRIVQSWDSNHWSTTSNQQMILNALSWFASDYFQYPELTAAVDAPQDWGLDLNTIINADFTNEGNYYALNANISLMLNGVVVNSTTVANFTDSDTHTLTYDWTPSSVGSYNFTAVVSQHANETDYSDNIVSQIVNVVELLDLNPGDYQRYQSGDHLLDRYEIQSYGANNLTVNGLRILYNQTTGTNVTVEAFSVNLLTGIVTGSWMDGSIYWGVVQLSGISIGSSLDWLDTTLQIYDQINYNFRGEYRTAWMGYAPIYNTTVAIDSNLGLFLDYGFGNILLLESNLLIADDVPNITSPDDIVYSSIETGNTLSWNVRDTDPDNYTIYQNGSVFDSGTYTDNVPIEINIDGIGVGVYNFTIIVFDRSNNFVVDQVYVTVMDISDPTLTDQTDTTIPIGSSVTLSWIAYDENPGIFELYRGNNLIYNGDWDSNITFVIDNLSAGNHYFTLVVYDQFGNKASDFVQVTVNNPNQGGPELFEADDITIPLGDGYYELSWEVSTGNPTSYKLYRDGTQIASGSISSDQFLVPITYEEVNTHNYTIVVKDNQNRVFSDSIFVTIADMTAPVIDDLNEMEIEFGSTGNIVNWTASDRYPGNFTLYHGDTIILEGEWTQNVTFSLDSFEIGSHYFTLVVRDQAGNEASDWMVVDVIGELNPEDFPLEVILGILSGVLVLVMTGAGFRIVRRRS